MFFLEMPYLTRQEIGELFFVLMIMLMMEKELGRNNLLILSIFFIYCIIVIALFNGLYLYFPLLSLIL